MASKPVKITLWTLLLLVIAWAFAMWKSTNDN